MPPATAFRRYAVSSVREGCHALSFMSSSNHPARRESTAQHSTAQRSREWNEAGGYGRYLGTVVQAAGTYSRTSAHLPTDRPTYLPTDRPTDLPIFDT